MAFVSSLVMSSIYFLILYSIGDSLKMLDRNAIGNTTASVILFSTFVFCLSWYFIEKLRLKIRKDIAPLYVSQEKFVIVLMQDNSIITYFREKQDIFKIIFSIKDNTLKTDQLFSTQPSSTEWKEVTLNHRFSISPLSITQAIYSYYANEKLVVPCLLNIECLSYSALYPYIKNESIFLEKRKTNAILDFQKQTIEREKLKLMFFNFIYYLLGFWVSTSLSIGWGFLSTFIFLPSQV